ncbi:hypothetical protein [Streptomyces sp. NPDC093223]|uniref:hypothetical protein n=1 Tax=Streptomyces sp. NPDC093223 TaxID=3366033 RepID=UPI003812ECF6
MSTTAKLRPNRPTRGQRSPLPPHGTSARGTDRPGQGIPGCKCQPCRNAKVKADAIRAIANMSSRPVRIPAAPVAAHLRNLLDAGMGWVRITRAAHSSSCTIARILNGQELVRRSVAERILAVKYRPAPGRYLDATGSRRRVQGMMVRGHTVVVIATEAALDHSVIHDILNGCPQVRGLTADKIAAAYDWLSSRQPTGRASAITVTRNRAARDGFAPPAAWDDDAIDDPNAAPDWTGCCGTDHGWWTHKAENIPVCARCQTAHDAWLAEHKNLPRAERARQLFLAKNTAAQRGANLAVDGRELLKHGVLIDQAAERLGVTRQYLQKELIRHPEAEESTQAGTELAA